uniref:Uncharacterized protein n=1 Tax=Gouania willdenowi TaxID=441366 RepID=A0A8C5GYA6_GOUWI
QSLFVLSFTHLSFLKLTAPVGLCLYSHVFVSCCSVVECSDRGVYKVPHGIPNNSSFISLKNNFISSIRMDLLHHLTSLQFLILSNNWLTDNMLSPLFNLRTLNLSHNQLTSVPMGLPPSIIELYLKGNLIKQLHERTFIGMTKLEVLDFSGNKLTNDGLGNSLNVTHLESLNLEANQLEQVPQTLPSSLKVLNLGSNLISSIKKVAFSNLKKLELLSVARNKVFEVAAGAFRALSFLHQLDFSHNTLQKVPRLLPRNVHSVSLSNNRIRSVPADAFCWGNQTLTIGSDDNVCVIYELKSVCPRIVHKHRAGDSTFNLGNFARRQENYELN